MLSDKMVKSLNHQINRELYSGYLYLGMASYSKNAGLSGVANWFAVQSQEEASHAMKFYEYVNDQGGRVVLEAIEEPPQDYSSALDMFDKTLEHEKKVTAMINELVALARSEKDTATEIMLQWFVKEQVEEEANASDMIQKLKLAGDGSGLFMIDNELGQRVFTPPVAEKE